MGEGTAGEFLYEIRRHATRFCPIDPSEQKNRQGSEQRGLLSYLSLGGVTKLKERWDEYRRENTSRRTMSLFVSPNGEYVAVAAGNEVVILQKDDGYMEPCGIFTNNSRATVIINGAWFEPQGILCLVDDLSTLYFIKANGEEITRRNGKNLKLSSSIIGLIVQDDLNTMKFSLSGFYIFTGDGSICQCDITQEPGACIYDIPISTNCVQPTTRGQPPQSVSCLDFHPVLSMVVLVGDARVSVVSGDYSGSYSLFLLQITADSKIDLMFRSAEFEGVFSYFKAHKALPSVPKVAISPQGKHVATLDLAGAVNIFNLDVISRSIYPDKKSEIGNKVYLMDTVDISWWIDNIVILAKKDGTFSMYDVTTGKYNSLNEPKTSILSIEGAKHRQGCVFTLESGIFEENLSKMESTGDSKHTPSAVLGNIDQPDTHRVSWKILSFSKITVSEMYAVLINDNKYQEALDFAIHYGLNTDEVFKAQWLHSEQGVNDIEACLSKIKDHIFVLSECVNRVGPTESILKALISFGLHITEQYNFSECGDNEQSFAWDIRIFRLRLLQLRDKLETFVGINMGRFLPEEYSKFRSMPLIETAIALAENGKIGALNLLFKRHPYALSPSILGILSSIPETVPVVSYCQLLPGEFPPNTVVLRDADWVECEKMVSFMEKLAGQTDKCEQAKTEVILKQLIGFVWPSVAELSDWYKNRARDIDNLSGLLENSLALVDFAFRKGLLQVKQFLDDTKYLHQLIYSDGSDSLTMSLSTWEQLPDYGKFKTMLKGIKEDMIVQRLRERAVPFMQSRLLSAHLNCEDMQEESYVVRWLKEVALENELAICLAVIENGCGDSPIDGLFRNLTEMTSTALHCIYVCSATDQWNVMASILSKLRHRTLIERSSFLSETINLQNTGQRFETPKASKMDIQHEESEKLSDLRRLLHMGSFPDNSREFSNQHDGIAPIDVLEERIKIAEGHVEVARLLAYYQVPKSMSFFLDAQSDEKNVKQLLRLVLSKFGRKQPGRSDNDWANMWRDMLSFQEKAFSFIDLEYLLTEFIRGLLKAGKFALARNYLRGTSSISLATEKAENLVIQAAREYFFSASTLSCSEVWKAKECLNLFPNSINVRAESDVIDAITIRLPNLGVNLLPVQFRQIKNPMEIINMVITSHSGAYLNVEEIIDIAKLLGLRAGDDIAHVEEAIAREAAVNGDLQLAFEICLKLARKGHGLVWDLCAAIARGPHLENMTTSSRKKLLGYALSHCDDESIGELLNAWKDFDICNNFEQLMLSTGTSPPNFSIQGSSLVSLPIHSIQEIFDLRENAESRHSANYINGDNDQDRINTIKKIISKVAKDMPTDDENSWDSFLKKNRKILSFAALELPWLLELCEDEGYGKEDILGEKSPSAKLCQSKKIQAINSIICWLAGNSISPRDDLIMSLAKSLMEPPVTDEDDVLGCSFLLNLMDPFNGVEVIEEELRKREVYPEIYSIMNVGMIYGSLNNAHRECSTPEQRRNLLVNKFHEKFASFDSDELDQISKVQTTFWREWKIKLEEEKRLADKTRTLKQIVPGIETSRFLSGDMNYIKNALFSFIDSVKLDKKHILKEAVKLADAYGLHRIEVLLHFLGCALVSDYWENHDILAEISEFREDIVKCARGVIDMISLVVYPEINGHNKQRLSYIFSILSACYLRLREDPEYMQHLEEGHLHIVEQSQYYKVLEQECQRVLFIDGLDFKNIAGLDDLNFDHFNEEICKNIHESTVDALADSVRALVSIYDDSQAKGLISQEGVYKHYVLARLASLEGRNEARLCSISSVELQAVIREIEASYDHCKSYVKALPQADVSYIIGRYCTLCFPCNFSRSQPHEPSWKEALLELITFWIKLVGDTSKKLNTGELLEKKDCFDSNRLLSCLTIFKRLVMNGEILFIQGWDTVSSFVKTGLLNGLTADVSYFCQAMIFSRCSFESVAETCCNTEENSESSTSDAVTPLNVAELYRSIADTCVSDLIKGFDRQQSLHNMLSSLSGFTNKHTEDLMKARYEVWENLTCFSENMQLDSHLRVYALQLMQSITGRNLSSLPPELTSQVEPWESWDVSSCTNAVSAASADVSSSITATLIALKSTQLLTAGFPSSSITPEHLSTLDSAVSCFFHLLERASTDESLSTLQAILLEWEQLFSTKTEQDQGRESSKESNDWSNDEWDEGWETLPDDMGSGEKNKHGSISVHPLHSCWMEMIRKLVECGKLRSVMGLLDRSSSRPYILLEEDEAQHLLELMAGMDCFIVLKVFLLLPHNGPRSRCLEIVETKMREGAISNASDVDEYELLVLVLSSGILHDFTNQPAYSKLFSYVCCLVGRFAKVCQDDILVHWKGGGRRFKETQSLFFKKVLLPCFISELVVNGQCLLAGFIISRWAHTHTSLGLIDVVEASLRRYLEVQVLQAQHPGNELGLEDDVFNSISCTLARLKSKSTSLLSSALSALPAQRRR